MSDKAHSSLTGDSLHELKGVSVAVDNTVATALNGQTVWKKLTTENFGPGLMPFSNNVMVVKDQRSSGTYAGTNVASSWTTATLNTVETNQISGASLSSNQIILPVGKYWIEAIKSVGGQRDNNTSVGGAKIRFRNITDNTTEVVGMSNWFTSGGTGETSLAGRFEVTGTSKSFALQYWFEVARSDGLGIPTDDTTPEVYARVVITKL